MKPIDDDSMDDDATCTEEAKLLCLPYVKGISERIEWGCQQLGVRVVFRLGNKLRQSLMKVKTPIDEDLKKGVRTYICMVTDCQHEVGHCKLNQITRVSRVDELNQIQIESGKPTISSFSSTVWGSASVEDIT